MFKILTFLLQQTVRNFTVIRNITENTGEKIMSTVQDILSLRCQYDTEVKLFSGQLGQKCNILLNSFSKFPWLHLGELQTQSVKFPKTFTGILKRIIVNLQISGELTSLKCSISPFRKKVRMIFIYLNSFMSLSKSKGIAIHISSHFL